MQDTERKDLPRHVVCLFQLGEKKFKLEKLQKGRVSMCLNICWLDSFCSIFIGRES